MFFFFFFFQAEDGIRDTSVTGVQTCALPISCIVNSLLYVSGSTTSAFAFASCARITSARTPPARKNARLVAMYRMPIRLWSVVVIQLTTRPSYHGTG